MLDGQPYTRQEAVGFVEFAADGWSNSSMFVFLIRNYFNDVLGAIDIKSPNPEGAEVGYWASSLHRGYMTNALTALLELARNAGYQSLCAYTEPSNLRSQGVLRRAGFRYLSNTTDSKGRPGEQFHIRL